MSLEITATKENIKEFPLHAHNTWEYMLYIKGNGCLKTDSEKSYKFAPDTFIAVPPGHIHGSSSDDCFVNICIHTGKKLIPGEDAFVYIEKVSEEVKSLYKLIHKSYFGDSSSETVNYLLMALANFLKSSSFDTDVEKAAKEVYGIISENFQNTDFNISESIEKCGFSDDYFRIQFKKMYGLTPYQYLIQLRMNYAKMLLETYGASLKIYEIARLCGYKDGLYFSKQFKKYYKTSPEIFIKDGN